MATKLAPSNPPKTAQIKNLEDYYRFVMIEYAKKGSDLICRLVPNCPGGDFAYTAYTWSKPAQLAWKLFRKPPTHIKDLPTLVLQTVHVPFPEDRICSATSPSPSPSSPFHANNTVDLRISKKEFDRLEATTTPGLRIWLVDLEHAHFLMIPSHAIMFTEEEGRSTRGMGSDGTDRTC